MEVNRRRSGKGNPCRSESGTRRVPRDWERQKQQARMRTLKAGEERVTQAGLAASPRKDAQDFPFNNLFLVA